METEEKKRLQWGETPWDDLSKEELLRECWKMFSALQSAESIIKQCRLQSLWHKLPSGITQEQVDKHMKALIKSDPFWGYGIGGRAMEEVRQALSRAEDFDREDVYRSFFRYATDLLFEEREGMEIGFGWDVCPVCGQMIGRSGDGKRHSGQACKDTASFGHKDECHGILRPLDWIDLQPRKAEPCT